MRGWHNEKGVMRPHESLGDAEWEPGLMLDDDVDLVAKETARVGLVDLSKVHFDVRVASANPPNPRWQDFLDLEWPGLNPKTSDCFPAPGDLDDFGESLEKRRAELEKTPSRLR